MDCTIPLDHGKLGIGPVRSPGGVQDGGGKQEKGNRGLFQKRGPQTLKTPSRKGLLRPDTHVQCGTSPTKQSWRLKGLAMLNSLSAGEALEEAVAHHMANHRQTMEALDVPGRLT